MKYNKAKSFLSFIVHLASYAICKKMLKNQIATVLEPTADLFAVLACR